MTQDHKRLLKYGLLFAAAVAGFWLLVTAIQNRYVTAVAVVIWWVFLCVIFYRDAQKQSSRNL